MPCIPIKAVAATLHLIISAAQLHPHEIFAFKARPTCHGGHTVGGDLSYVPRRITKSSSLLGHLNWCECSAFHTDNMISYRVLQSGPNWLRGYCGRCTRP